MKFEGSNESFNKQVNFHFDNLYFHHPQSYESVILYQIGDLSCKAGFLVGEHEQLCYEISYIASGKGIFYMNKKAYPVQEGDIILNVPGELHDCRADAVEPFRYFYLGFNFTDPEAEHNSLTHIRKMFDQTLNPIVPNKLGIHLPFVGIFSELINLKNDSALMIETYLRQIIIQTYRSFYDTWATDYAQYIKSEGNEPKQTVYEVIHYIDANLHHMTELTQIAEDLHYSYSYLSHLFSKEIGLTIKEYYNRKRFEKAVEWLKSGELNVTQIAEKLQYQSIHTFSKAFRKNFGISPTEYQTLSMNAKKEQ